MHLNLKTSKYKGKIYKSYSIAESYREGKSVKKRILWAIGKLTELQAQQIKKICKVVTDPEHVLTTIQQIVVQKCKAYGDLFIADALWEKWKISRAFKAAQTDSDLSTPLVARILTINRCVSPCSHYSIPKWVETTAVSEILNVDLSALNDDKIYYELDKIDQNHECLENHLFQMSYQADPDSYHNVNYDLSSSYFVGFKCDLSKIGNSKDEKPHNKQVLLGILVNDKGYPFKWDVYPGNTAEVNTLVHNVDACSKRFKLKNINLVFDRGIVADDNLTYIEKETLLKYISALDKNQIPNVESIDLSVFKDITLQNFSDHLTKQDFKKYDDSLYYQDLGQINQRRYVLGFNPDLFENEQTCRREKITCFENFLKAKNVELQHANRSRKASATTQCVIKELRRLKIKKYFHDPVLTEINVSKTGNASRTVDSFQITVQKKEEVIAHWELLDGLCVFISNHIEQNGGDFRFAASQIITAYREKTKIEDAFKHIKSFLKLRPFYVNTDAHVRAVYDISVLAYFLNKDLAERRKKIEKIDYLNSKSLYEPFKKYHYTTIKDEDSGQMKTEPMKFDSKLTRYIKQLGLKVSQ